MSSQMGKLCSLILLEYFGDVVEKVGMDLFRGGAKTLKLIGATTKLTLNEVRQAMCLLLKYGLATFNESKTPNVAEYKLLQDKIILLLRYPKYLMLLRNFYGNDAEIIIEEILKHGRDIAPLILYRSVKRVSGAENDTKPTIIQVTQLQRIRDIFEMLINKRYIKRAPKLVEKKPVPNFLTDESEQFTLCKIDIPILYEALTKNTQLVPAADDVYWEVNFDRFHQDLRDDLLVLATARRTNSTGREIMRFLLQLMHLKSNPWAPVSNPILTSDLKDFCTRSGADVDLIKNLEDYLVIMTEDFGGFLRKSQMMTSAYEVNLKNALIEMTWCVLASGVDAKYGSNAARIFRLIREQEFIEQDEIQKKAMLPDKEAKFLTYSLLQSGWIQQHELKKSLQKAGPSKTFYLFYIDFELVVRMYIQVCYKSLYNAITLREQEKAINKCLLEKKQRIDAIVLHLKKEGATDEQVAEIEEMITPPEHALLEKIHLNVNKVSQAELQIDETLFILQLCINFSSSCPEVKTFYLKINFVELNHKHYIIEFGKCKYLKKNRPVDNEEFCSFEFNLALTDLQAEGFQLKEENVGL